MNLFPILSRRQPEPERPETLPETEPETPTKPTPMPSPEPERHPDWDPRRFCPSQRKRHIVPEIP